MLAWFLLLLLPSAAAAIGLLPKLGRVLPPSSSHPGVSNCTVSWHTQALDHFDYSEQRTWSQRVFSFDKYWVPGGPILFYCGNEANVELYVNATGFMWEHAAQLKAKLVFAEHRYYGESLPLGPSSTANASTLRWLTMEQALADYASLIYSLKGDAATASTTRVVAIGGSYGGMLAAWLRMHYPSSVDGAIAASAPVLAFGGMSGVNSKWDSNAYWRVVTADATETHGGCAPGCVAGVRSSWPALFAKGQSSSGRAWLASTFRLCDSALTGAADVERLAAWLLNLWDTLAMGNFPYASNYLVFQQTGDPSIKLPPWPFRAACEAFRGATASTAAEALLEHMATAAGVLYNVSGRERCYAVPDDPNYDGIWDYQWCTERLPQETYFSLNGTADMFYSRPFDADAIAKHCQHKYGLPGRLAWVPATSRFNSPTSASNIVFSNGGYDPWRSGGVLRSLSPTLEAIDIEHGAHHLDLFFSNPADPPSVKAARASELAAIKRWIGVR